MHLIAIWKFVQPHLLNMGGKSQNMPGVVLWLTLLQIRLMQRLPPVVMPLKKLRH